MSKMYGRGFTSCLLCKSERNLVLGHDFALKVIRIRYETNNYNIMLQNTKICMICIGRLQQLNEFCANNELDNEKETNLDINKRSCDFCLLTFSSHELLDNEKLLFEEIQYIHWIKISQTDQKTCCCYSCYNFLVTYNDLKILLNDCNNLYFDALKRWRISLEDCSDYFKQKNVSFSEIVTFYDYEKEAEDEPAIVKKRKKFTKKIYAKKRIIVKKKRSIRKLKGKTKLSKVSEKQNDLQYESFPVCMEEDKENDEIAILKAKYHLRNCFVALTPLNIQNPLTISNLNITNQTEENNNSKIVEPEDDYETSMTNNLNEISVKRHSSKTKKVNYEESQMNVIDAPPDSISDGFYSHQSIEIEFLHPEYKNKVVLFENSAKKGDEFISLGNEEENSSTCNNLEILDFYNAEYLEEADPLAKFFQTSSQNNGCQMMTLDELLDEECLAS